MVIEWMYKGQRYELRIYCDSIYAPEVDGVRLAGSRRWLDKSEWPPLPEGEELDELVAQELACEALVAADSRADAADAMAGWSWQPSIARALSGRR